MLLWSEECSNNIAHLHYPHLHNARFFNSQHDGITYFYKKLITDWNRKIRMRFAKLRTKQIDFLVQSPKLQNGVIFLVNWAFKAISLWWIPNELKEETLQIREGNCLVIIGNYVRYLPRGNYLANPTRVGQTNVLCQDNQTLCFSYWKALACESVILFVTNRTTIFFWFYMVSVNTHVSGDEWRRVKFSSQNNIWCMNFQKK